MEYNQMKFIEMVLIVVHTLYGVHNFIAISISNNEMVKDCSWKNEFIMK